MMVDDKSLHSKSAGSVSDTVEPASPVGKVEFKLIQLNPCRRDIQQSRPVSTGSAVPALLRFMNSGADLLCAERAVGRWGQLLSPAAMLAESPSGSA